MTNHIMFRITKQKSNKSNAQIKPNKSSAINKAAWLKGFGLFFTALITVSAFAPDFINVPMEWRPWLFVTFIFWIVFYVSGMLA